MIPVGAGEGALAVAEQFALHQVLGQGPAVHRHERHVRALTLLVQRARHQLLARAGLAEDHDGGVGRRHRRDQAVHRLHGRRTAYQHGRPLGRDHTVLQGNVLVLQHPLFRDLLENGLNLDQLARLGDVVKGAQAHGVDGRLHAGVAGHDDGFGMRRHLLQVFQDLDTGHARHAQIENRDVEAALLEHLHGGPAVRADRDFVADARQLRAHEFLERFLIVHEQDAQRLMRRRGQANLQSPSALVLSP